MSPKHNWAVIALVWVVLGACGGSESAGGDPCAAGPCTNGGACSVVEGQATCACAAGWTGPTCDILGGCTSASCGTGSCTDDGTGVHTCHCVGDAFFDGRTCAQCPAIAGCVSVQCTSADNATCATCSAGFVSDGSGCRPLECQPGQFESAGTCVACTPVAHCEALTCASEASSTCTRCAAGYGLQDGACREIDDCAGGPCGHGECTDLGDDYSCQCDDGYYSDATTCARCPSVAHCEAWVCSGASDSACTRCSTGWINDDGVCREADPCDGDPCGSGTCVGVAGGDYRCDCDDGYYDDGARCVRCTSVAHCQQWTCSDADDSECTRCAPTYVANGAGGCKLPSDRCSDVKTLLVGASQGDTLGAGDDASGCTFVDGGGSSFVIGEGAEDETWSFELTVRTLVTLTVTGFDSGIYLLSGSSCPNAQLLEETCADFEAGDSETYSGVLNAGKYWLLVDGYAVDGPSTGGPYTIEMEKASACEDGLYATATSCRACSAVSGCAITTCTSASDATCMLCEEGLAMTEAGTCVALTCDLVLAPGVLAQGDTLGKGDNSSGCELDFSDGSSFVVGEGAEDEVWSLNLAQRSLVTITVTGFDAAIYLERGPSCAGGALNEHACIDVEAGDSETLVAVLEAGQHWVVVDGYTDGVGSTGGPYEIEVVLEDPCGGVSPEGACNGTDLAQWCIVPPAGISFAATASTYCDADEVCREIGGVSRCLPPQNATTCDRTMAFCDGDTIVWCDAPGPLSRAACANGCWSRYGGAFCAPDLVTETFVAFVDYEYRLPNAQLTDWSSERRLAPVRGATLYSWHWNGSDYEVIDSARSEHDGYFEIQIASPPSPDDFVGIYAMRTKPIAAELSFAVAEPDVGEGEQPIEGVAQGAVYSWSIAATDSGNAFALTDEDGSGAMRLFDVMSLVYENTAELFYRDVQPKSVVVWMRVGTTWTCGECHWGQFTDAIGDPMESQMFVPASALDQSYWADAVTLHEAGHWTMAAFGTSPKEGGPHVFGHAYYPGLAWSEGWATWLSSDWRAESRYLDKQDGSMFWVDIGDRTSFYDWAWPRPVPADGLTGRMNEIEVSAMLWRLSLDPEVSSNALYLALNAPRAQLALRGYTRHEWDLDEDYEPTNVVDTGEPAVTFADFLDALVCAGVPSDIAARVDEVTEPDVHYAYPSDAPMCAADVSGAPAAPTAPMGSPEEHGIEPPFVLDLIGPDHVKPSSTVTLVARIVRTPGVLAPLEVTVSVPAGARLVGGKPYEVIDSDEVVVSRSYLLAIDDVPRDDVGVLVSSETTWWGARALDAYRFGRPEPRRVLTERSGPELKRGGLRLGRPIPLRPMPR